MRFFLKENKQKISGKFLELQESTQIFALLTIVTFLQTEGSNLINILKILDYSKGGLKFKFSAETIIFFFERVPVKDKRAGHVK